MDEVFDDPVFTYDELKAIRALIRTVFKHVCGLNENIELVSVLTKANTIISNGDRRSMNTLNELYNRND